MLFFGFLIGASDPARKLAEVWSNLQRGMAASERLYEVIDRPIRVMNPIVAVDVLGLIKRLLCETFISDIQPGHRC